MFSAAAFSILPYLTIHMKDIGISDLDVALIYTILPFCVFIAPPLVGFFADKLGNYTRVLMVNVVLTGVFHTLLLAVPHTVVKDQYPTMNATVVEGSVLFKWDECEELNSTNTCNIMEDLPSKVKLSFSNCALSCENGDNDETYDHVEEAMCQLMKGAQCKANPVRRLVSLKGLLPNITQTGCREAKLELLTTMDPCESGDMEFREIQLPPGCKAYCSAVTNMISKCGTTDNGNRILTNTLYFIIRTLATMSLASVFIMLDAQTIQMCKIEEANGKSGSYGRQILYKTLAQAIISPLTGLLMDKITYMTGYTNYVAPFLISDLFLLGTLICVCFLDGDIGLPKDSDTMKGVKVIFSNISISVFILMMFVCGSMFGFVETFLFVYLKEDLNAPIYLLGLTITTGALVSIPFLYYSDILVDKFGVVNVFILALLMYGVRYVGYSLITCAWYAFPFEALEVFTIFLLRVGMARYIKMNAPPGTLATLTGMAGGAHYGFGKGVGGLVGGVLKDQLGSMALAFRTFGIASFAFGIIYALFYLLIGRSIDKKSQIERKMKESEAAKQEPLLSEGNPIVKN